MTKHGSSLGATFKFFAAPVQGDDGMRRHEGMKLKLIFFLKEALRMSCLPF